MEYLKQLHLADVTDLHLSSTGKGWKRQHGILSPCQEDSGSLQRVFAYLEEASLSVKESAKGVKDFSLNGAGFRMRVHSYCSAGEQQISVRFLAQAVPALSELNLFRDVERLFQFSDGLVLIGGPAGSGKSTMLAALLAHMIAEQSKHIMTFESPIEYVMPAGRSLVHQCEIPNDVESLQAALSSALRADPDVLMVGEIRTMQEMRAVIELAETGHLIFATIHTPSAADAIFRVLDWYTAEEKDMVRRQLAASLRAVYYQRLLPGKRSEKRVPVSELLLVDAAAAQMIRDNRMHQLNGIMENSGNMGMWSLEQCLLSRIQKGEIEENQAMMITGDPVYFKEILKRNRDV